MPSEQRCAVSTARLQLVDQFALTLYCDIYGTVPRLQATAEWVVRLCMPQQGLVRLAAELEVTYAQVLHVPQVVPSDGPSYSAHLSVTPACHQTQVSNRQCPSGQSAAPLVGLQTMTWPRHQSRLPSLGATTGCGTATQCSAGC